MRLLLPLCILATLVGCNSDTPTPPESAASGPEFQLVTDIKQVMNWIMEPASDVIWDSVGTIISEAGQEDIAPETDEQWNAIRDAAAIVAESGNLLLIGSRARDQGDWAKHAHELTKAAQGAIQAAEAKDVDSLFTAGGEIYLACSACHAQYALELQKVN